MQPSILVPERFDDDRGYLFEAYNRARFEEVVGSAVDFVQDNHSHSNHGVLRGLHYQLPPAEQGKLIRVVSGAIFDVAVDVRRSSPRFGTWTGHHLSAGNRAQFWVPPGFAHGFLVLSDTADVVYKMTGYHAPEYARSIRWDDPTLAIEWPLDGISPILSESDRTAPSLTEAEIFD
jgi:dTDP-4-dehydrorhamnose 3,5-epimerase